MNKEKQIEEMAFILGDACAGVPHKVCETTPCNHCRADALYNAGYRKQSEGEWIKYGYKYQCTQCKVLMDIDGTPSENLLHYCPNCGARMRGE